MTEMVKATVNGDYDIWLPIHRAERPEWYSKKGWEKKRLDHMHKTIGKGDVVYYVGSEEGEFPAFCQMWGAKVMLFEPNPKVWSNTKVIWEANKLDPPMAVFEGFASDDWSSEYGTKFYRNTFPPCADQPIEAAHGFKNLATEGDNFERVTIDVLVANSTPIPTVISLDVEGSEGRVLRGAEETLKKHKPKIYLSLHPEFIHEQYGEWGAELRKWLIDLGYKETLLDYPLHEVHLYYEKV